MRYLLFLLVISMGLYGQSIDQLIEVSLKKHLSLEVIKKRIDANRYQQLNTMIFENPRLKLGINDIRLDDIGDRGLERMQSEYVMFTQKIPYFGKRDARMLRVSSDEVLLEKSLNYQKNRLAFAIKINAIDIWNINTKTDILKKITKTIKQNKELSSIYYNDAGSAESIVAYERMLYSVGTKIKNLKIAKKSKYVALRYLSGEKVENLQMHFVMDGIKTMKMIQSKLERYNPSLQSERAKIKIKTSDLELARLSQYPDTKLSAGYFRREAFDDYLSFSVGVSLPVYGREENEIERQMILKSAQIATYEDIKRKIISEAEQVILNMAEDRNSYLNLKNNIKPSIQRVISIKRDDAAHGVAQLGGILSATKEYLEVSIDEVDTLSAYHRSNAKLEFLLGDI